MSADNWQKCPKCLAKYKSEQDAAKKKIDKQYGKVSPDEWQQMLAEWKEEQNRDFPETFREDYSHGMCIDGRYVVDYSGMCERCGFSHKYKHIQQVL